ncbi:MAG TPA: class I SAM-dependent methyltransferase [Bryobacteraceae bacterium]|nr:class I SAM-dependent methyltransferase [Bryobacteraceae bacterium]
MDKNWIDRMREDWNKRARENARHYVQNAAFQWEDREFFRSGEINVANEVMSDASRICGGNRSPLDLRMLEIGCGVGRMTRMLARIFQHVTAVDISEEMICQARKNLGDLHNVTLIVGDGHSLAGLDSEHFDFAFSFIVFQHIPSYDVIRSYCQEVFRVLKPGSLFKFQLQGDASLRPESLDTWLGIPVSEVDAYRLAEESGFDVELTAGAGSQYFWLWFRKPVAVK